MSHRLHPNQFQAMLGATDNEEHAGSMSVAMKFLQGNDQEDESLRLRRRRRSERAAAARVSYMAARVVAGR